MEPGQGLIHKVNPGLWLQRDAHRRFPHSCEAVSALVSRALRMRALHIKRPCTAMHKTCEIVQEIAIYTYIHTTKCADVYLHMQIYAYIYI